MTYLKRDYWTQRGLAELISSKCLLKDKCGLAAISKKYTL